MNQIFDAHFHIIDGQFPLIENNGYIPPEFCVKGYKASTQSLNIIGGAVVSGSFQGFDQGYLLNALKILGPGYVGVTQIPASTKDAEILQLNSCGVKAVRFNIKRGGSAQIKDLAYLSQKVFELANWHTELYVDSKDLKDLMPTLLKIKKFSIDHLGLSKEGVNELKTLVEHGAKIKATGFGRLDFEPVSLIKELNAINPQAVLFGTDLPSTRSPKPFSMADVNLLIQNFDPQTLERIFYKNALDFYGVEV